MGQFETGQKKPKGSGRKKGTTNKQNQQFSVLLENCDLNIIERLNSLLPALNPEKQADVLLNLLNYLYPKKKTIEHREFEDKKSQCLEVRFFKPDTEKDPVN